MTDDDPIAEEGRRILAEDPELHARIRDVAQRLERGEVPQTELTSTTDVRLKFGLPQGG